MAWRVLPDVDGRKRDETKHRIHRQARVARECSPHSFANHPLWTSDSIHDRCWSSSHPNRRMCTRAHVVSSQETSGVFLGRLDTLLSVFNVAPLVKDIRNLVVSNGMNCPTWNPADLLIYWKYQTNHKSRRLLLWNTTRQQAQQQASINSHTTLATSIDHQSSSEDLALLSPTASAAPPPLLTLSTSAFPVVPATLFALSASVFGSSLPASTMLPDLDLP